MKVKDAFVMKQIQKQFQKFVNFLNINIYQTQPALKIHIVKTGINVQSVTT